MLYFVGAGLSLGAAFLLVLREPPNFPVAYGFIVLGLVALVLGAVRKDPF